MDQSPPKVRTAPQRWDPARYARNARFVSDLGQPLIELLAPRPGEAVLDLGCGDGVLSEKIAGFGAEVIAVDSSSEQIAAARERGIEAMVMDGQSLDFAARFDAVFSNAALHWMVDADAVIDGVWRALKAPGRFVGEMGGAGNVELIRTALVSALEARGLDGATADFWFFPSPDDYRRRLEARGFAVRSIELFPRPTELPGELVDWLETFGESFFALVAEADRPAFTAEVCDLLRPELCKDGRWTADYVRLRFAADKSTGSCTD